MSTQFGVVPNIGISTDDKINIAKNMNVNLIRTATIIQDWNGEDLRYERFVDDGFDVALNINNSRQGGVAIPFPIDMKKYGGTFKAITDKYKPKVIVVENEEINTNYHKGTMPQYVTMLDTAYPICEAAGLKMTNGGIYGVALDCLTYKFKVAQKQQAEADSFAHYTLTDGQVKYCKGQKKNAPLDAKVKDMITLLDAYKKYCYAVNLHEYELLDETIKGTPNEGKTTHATPIVLQYITEYIKSYTGKECVSNEFGQRNNQQPELTKSMMQQYIDLNIEFAIIFNGLGTAGSEAYTDSKGQLNDLGKAFVGAIK